MNHIRTTFLIPVSYFLFPLSVFAMPWSDVALKCKSNIGIVKEPIRGIVLEHHGCGCGACGREKGQSVTNYQNFAVKDGVDGWLYIHARTGSLWANEQTVALTDEIIDAAVEHYGLKPDIPIISTGYSMGGMCTLVWPVFTKYHANVKAVFANCPVTDLVEQYDYVCTFTNSWGRYLRKTIEDGYPDAKGPAGREALKARSPRHIVDRLVDVPYYVNHGTADKAVVKESHSDAFVPLLKAAGRNVTYFVSEGSGHCSISKAVRPQWNAAYRAEMRRAAPPAEPGLALVDENWANGWSGWTVSNRDDIVSMEAKDGVLHLENKRAKGDKGLSFFTIRSGLVKVEPGRDIVAIMESRGNLNMLMPVTNFRAKENEIRSFLPATAILWYTADKQPLLAMDVSGVKLPTGSSFGFKEMTDAFSCVRHFATVPKGASYAALQIGGQYPSFHPGSWLELRRLALRMRDGADGNWDFGDVKSPEFERVSPSPDPNPNAPFVFRILDESPIVKLTVKLDGVDVTDKVKVSSSASSSARMEFICPFSNSNSTLNPQPVLTVPHAPWANESLHRLAVEATDAAGNVGRETLATYCGPKPKGPVCRVRDDGVILLDGKPTFLIGTCGARPSPANGYDIEKMCADFAANGFNLIQCNYSYRPGGKVWYDGAADFTGYKEMKDLEAFHAAARRHGLYLKIETASRDYGTEKRVEELVAAGRFYRDRPELIIHELADDTASHVTADVLKNDSNVLRAVDDFRFTAQPDENDYEGRYEPYAKATDIFAQEIYPFRNAEHEPEGLAQVIRNCEYAYDGLKKSGAKNRSIWTIPQAFAGAGLWKKYPSREIIRAQVFLALIHGCRGMWFYVYWSKGTVCFGDSPEHAEEVFSVTRDVAAIADDLTSRDAKVQPKAEIIEGPKTDPGDYASVSCLMKDGADGKGQLLLTASSLVYGSVKAKIRVKGEGLRVETLFENGRKPDFKDGVLTDSFGPGEVHVYRLRHSQPAGL